MIKFKKPKFIDIIVGLLFVGCGYLAYNYDGGDHSSFFPSSNGSSNK
jgi:hypothetical protein